MSHNRVTSSFLKFFRSLSLEYHVLFTFVFTLNLAGVIAFLVAWMYRGSPSEKTCAFATTLNLTISIIIRVEYVINILFHICSSIPRKAPLWLRRRFGKIYHLGGLHSGCAVAATFWFILLSIQSTLAFDFTRATSTEKWCLLIIIYILDLLLVAMLAMAYPSVREKLHNAFELTHRLAGWSSLAFFWALTVLETDISRKGAQNLSTALCLNPNIWFLCIATLSVIITWTNCRKINVHSERLSNHALQMHFDYATPQPGTTIRLSTSPLFEWHAFATWAQPGQKGFSLIISNAGDWTKRIIENPPRKIWARRTPTCGVMRIAPMFKSVLLVATGSGIAPCLPVIMAQRTRISLFWSTRDPLKTYGPELAKIITAMGNSAHIHDTTTMGRPSTLPEVLEMYRETNSEAVIVISNPGLTLKLVQDLEQLGVPAFGPIWDS